MAAYEDMFEHTSTEIAPWYIVPADHKWFTRLATAAIICEKLKQMDPQYPTITEEDRQKMLACREVLIAEEGEEKQKK
jgi:hypothetical protein